MKKKLLAVGIILLFVGTCIIPAIAQDTEKSLPISRGNWLYVGGDEPGNYTRIQDALNDASPGDTVFVYHGIYHETLSINIIDLVVHGENKDTTVISANSSTAITIKQDSVVIEGFTIFALHNSSYGDGIYISEDVHNVRIANNNLSNNHYGITIDAYNTYDVVENNIFYANFLGVTAGVFFNDGHALIRNNRFVGDFLGLDLHGTYNEILNNTFLDCSQEGMNQYGGLSTIQNNVFLGNRVGLLTRYGGNAIIGNHFEKNQIGLKGEGISEDLIQQNNFIENHRHAVFSELNRSHGVRWDGNYWGGSSCLLDWKPIFGSMKTRIPRLYQPPIGATEYYSILWLNFDRHPAKEPYDIPQVKL